MSPLPHPISSPDARTAGRVGIRPITRRDAHRVRELLNNNREWLEPWEATFPGGGGAVPGSVPFSPVIRAMKQQQRQGSAITFVITYDGRVVGQLSLSDISGGALRSTSIGYWIAKEVAGQGVTTTAVALAIDYAFTELRMHRIEICIRPENAASLRVVEKLALRHEGSRKRYIHIAGAWRDHECYALTVEEAPRTMLERIGAPTASRDL